MSEWVARAPGRLDVMGGIADYSGSLVLQWPIRESTTVRVRALPSPHLRVLSTSASSAPRAVDVPLALINRASPPYDEIRAWFVESADRHWAAYVAGVCAVLAAEHGVRWRQGPAIEVSSEVPEGKGVSSSAALEAAALTALLAALEHEPSAAGVQADAPRPRLSPREQAQLCQRAENLVVGAPCGVMDQMAVICGRAGHLMSLLCQPAELQAPLRLPDDLAVFGIDSGIRHAVTGSDYTAVRVGAFMGYRILADVAGCAVRPGGRDGQVVVDDPQWHGYLANVGSDAFQAHEVHIPRTMRGTVFLKRYGGTTDPVTRVDPDRCYAIWTPTAHPVYEHERVTEWASLLQPRHAHPEGEGARASRSRRGRGRSRFALAEGQGARQLHRGGEAGEQARETRLGELMYQSHASYTACGLGSDGTDLLVAFAREAGERAGIFGAKITGGGSGGTVAILARPDAAPRVHQIAADYAERTGREPYVFEGTSEGAAVTGAWRG